MVNTNNADGTLRLVLGDIIATFAKDGKNVARAAIDAQIDVKLAPTGSTTTALNFGDADLRINLLDSRNATITEEDLTAAASKGISLQLDSLSKLLVTLPIPSLEGIQRENVSVGGAKGYILVSGRMH
ncbi:MAG TPA: hypothetical protein VFP84_24615 [Kofleriaceae bacterium]|nr:hypothetical protein [Kofleriaceae bacterium]